MINLKHKQSLANEIRETNNGLKEAHETEQRRRLIEIRVTKADQIRNEINKIS
jgi:hypothetical protein